MNQDENNASFRHKWGGEVAFRGFTQVPKCLITCQRQLGLTNGEFNTLLQLLSFHFFTNKDPFPSMQRIASQMNISERMVRRHVRSLETNGFIKRKYRKNKTNEFRLIDLRYKLRDHLSIEGCTGQFSPPLWSDLSSRNGQKSPILTGQVIPPNNTNGIEKFNYKQSRREAPTVNSFELDWLGDFFNGRES